MNTLMRGSENVKKLMETLGGPIPREAEPKSLASLQKIIRNALTRRNSGGPSSPNSRRRRKRRCGRTSRRMGRPW